MTDYENMPRQQSPREPSRVPKSSGSSAERSIQLPGSETKNFPPILLPQRRRTSGDPCPSEESTSGATASQKVFREHSRSKVRRGFADHSNVFCRKRGSGTSSTDVSTEKRRILAG